MEWFVSTSGSDSNPGTKEAPFRTIARGLQGIGPGDVLTLRQGIYVEPVNILAKRGTSTAPIEISSAPGERAIIDGTLGAFRRAGNTDWRPAIDVDRDAKPDEFVSTQAFPGDPVNHGAFIDRNPYTRLITYARLKDLRADNQTFERLPGEDPLRPGPAIVNEDGTSTGTFAMWSYMGPGLWFDRQNGLVHVRLRHTANGVPGIDDYRGETDPRRVALAVSPEKMIALRIEGSRHLRLVNLTVRFGGENTIHLDSNQDVTFDHVRIQASRFGARTGSNSGVVFKHCEFRGGVPTWYFRNDRKGNYHFREEETGPILANTRGAETSQALIFTNVSDGGIEFDHCEFLSGHDLSLDGRDVDFHHNWINNMQDDGLVVGFAGVGTGPVTATKIHHNVMTRVLTALSISEKNVTTRWLIYRNLIDQRGVIAATRPRYPGDTKVFRHGQLHKSTGTDLGPHDLFQNTFLTAEQRDEQADFLHYSNTRGPHRRRCFNNVFVAVEPGPVAERAISFVPTPLFPGPTDGNFYHRIGPAEGKVLRHLAYDFGDAHYGNHTFDSLAALEASDLFIQSQTQYPPGYEAGSHTGDPGFRRIGADGRFRDTDDLRLREGGAAVGAGAELDDDLEQLDPVDGKRDVGCYPRNAEPLRVGVDGRRAFPS